MSKRRPAKNTKSTNAKPQQKEAGPQADGEDEDATPMDDRPEKMGKADFMSSSSKTFESLFAVILGLALTRVAESVFPSIKLEFSSANFTMAAVLTASMYLFLISSIVSTFLIISLHLKYNYVYKFGLSEKWELIFDLAILLFETFWLFAMSNSIKHQYELFVFFLFFIITDLIWVIVYQFAGKHTEFWIAVNSIALLIVGACLYFFRSGFDNHLFVIALSLLGTLRGLADYWAGLKHLVAGR